MRDPRPAPPYAGYDVLDKWASVSFDELTRQVVKRRMDDPPERRFFTEQEFRTLEAACARLLATAPERPPIASAIDADLFHGRGEGFRSPEMPPLPALWRLGLAGLDGEAARRHGKRFAALDGALQDATLRALQRGEVDTALFDPVPAPVFFTQVLLKAAAAHFYSRPEAWSEIGFGGPASPRGYVRMDLDRRDPWEAPLRSRRRARSR